MAYENNAEITYRQDINSELMIVRIKSLDATPFDFTPGQYAEISVIGDSPVEKIERRQYSIASAASGNSKEIELYIVLVQGGFLTTKLWQMKPGDKLWVNPKCKGKFTLEHVVQNKDFYFVATGTGLAPFISMIKTYKENPPWKNVVIIHGVRYERDLGYREEVLELTKKNPQITYIPATTRESTSSEILNGRIPKLFNDGDIQRLTKLEFSPEQSQVFLCGNPEMIDSMEQQLLEKGFKLHKKKEPGNLHLERYW
jgi:ferredoxin/flavodoxin---NADP+ reductase